jgi:hypothetical protein
MHPRLVHLLTQSSELGTTDSACVARPGRHRLLCRNLNEKGIASDE